MKALLVAALLVLACTAEIDEGMETIHKME